MSIAQPLLTQRRAANLWAAWLVHIYTASGALCAFFGTLAVFSSRYRDAFLLMALATFLDATDGVLARAAAVKAVLPGFDGARLDDIVDYLTFVFLPALLLYQSGALPSGWGALVASCILLSSAYGFASGDAKTDDHFFTGFPSYWNIVALYLYAAKRSAGDQRRHSDRADRARVRPNRIRVSDADADAPHAHARYSDRSGRCSSIAVIYTLPDVPGVLLAASLFFPAYYVVLSLVLQMRRARALRPT